MVKPVNRKNLEEVVQQNTAREARHRIFDPNDGSEESIEARREYAALLASGVSDDDILYIRWKAASDGPEDPFFRNDA